MAPLKSLEADYPIIDSKFQQFCASLNIFSVEEFLVRDIYTLVASTQQHSNSERLKQGITVVLSIIDSLHQPWLNGVELLEEAEKDNYNVSTGYERIDMLLQGGFCKGHLVELVGPSSSGKTQICLKAAANIAKNDLGRVIFYDTGNSFSPKRICKYIDQIFDPAGIKTDHPVQMLIVDSISSLVTPILGSGAHGRSLMTSVGFLLKELAYEHNLSVLVTNHMVGGEGGHLKPALGESWKNIPHSRLLLSRDRESNICSISIIRHPCIAAGKAVRFSL